MLKLASVLCFFIGLAHSMLGEKYILVRLLRFEKLPRLFGNDHFTRHTLRFAWHLTTVAWWGFGVLLWTVTGGGDMMHVVLLTSGTVFLISGLLSFVFTRGRHLSWIVFWAIAAISLAAALAG